MNLYFFVWPFNFSNNWANKLPNVVQTRKQRTRLNTDSPARVRQEPQETNLPFIACPENKMTQMNKQALNNLNMLSNAKNWNWLTCNLPFIYPLQMKKQKKYNTKHGTVWIINTCFENTASLWTWWVLPASFCFALTKGIKWCSAPNIDCTQ